MHCTNCDTELPPGAAFCPTCGMRATRNETAAPTTTFPSPSERSYDTPPAGIPALSMPPAAEPMTNIPPYYPGLQPQTANTAVVSLVFGILAWTLLPLISAIVAVIAGHMARRQISNSEGRLSGDGLAVAGMILGYIQIIFAVIGGCLLLIFLIFIAGVAAS